MNKVKAGDIVRVSRTYSSGYQKVYQRCIVMRAYSDSYVVKVIDGIDEDTARSLDRFPCYGILDHTGLFVNGKDEVTLLRGSSCKEVQIDEMDTQISVREEGIEIARYTKPVKTTRIRAYNNQVNGGNFCVINVEESCDTKVRAEYASTFGKAYAKYRIQKLKQVQDDKSIGQVLAND